MKAGRLALVIWLVCAPGALADYDACLNADSKDEAKTAVSACTSALAEGGLSDAKLAEVLHHRGVALRNTGDLQASEKDLRQAVDLAPDKAGYQRMLAWTLRRHSFYESAELYLTRSLTLEDHWQGYLSRCVVRLDMYRPGAALPDCEAALQRWPSEDSVYFWALANTRLENWPDAVAKIRYWRPEDIDSARLRALELSALRMYASKDQFQRARDRANAAFPDAKELRPFR